MANNITLFQKWVELLDEVYQQSSLTSVFDGNNSLVRMGANANEIIIPKISMDGLADYSRRDGYVSGDVTLTNETVTFNYDRSRRFTVDAMDNEETAGIAFGRLASEFIRTKVVPELDAFRIATYAGTSGISTASAASFGTGTDVLEGLITAQNTMDENEIPYEGRTLLITPSLYNMVQNVDTTKSKAVLASFSSIIRVPQSRFYTAVDLLDGTSEGETAGGFKKADGAKNINFMVIKNDAVLQYQKHTVNKIVTPEQNQTSDGWMFFYRAYGLADVYDNKLNGIYLSCASE